MIKKNVKKSPRSKKEHKDVFLCNLNMQVICEYFLSGCFFSSHSLTVPSKVLDFDKAQFIE